jgi:hypothetical protein
LGQQPGREGAALRVGREGSHEVVQVLASPEAQAKAALFPIVSEDILGPSSALQYRRLPNFVGSPWKKIIAVHHLDLNSHEYNSGVNDYHIIVTHAALEDSNFTKEDLQNGGGEGKSLR